MAMKHVQTAGFWISRDIQCADESTISTDTEGRFLRAVTGRGGRNAKRTTNRQDTCPAETGKTPYLSGGLCELLSVQYCGYWCVVSAWKV